jgi:hypothetical protein
MDKIPTSVPYIERLEGVPRGLRLTRYGGGDTFRSAREVVQYCCFSVPQDLKQKICEKIHTTPDKCSWESSFSISTNILGDDGSKEPSKVNLYFHGWLFENDVAIEKSASQKNPLVGLFSPFVGFSEYIDRSLIGETASAGINFLRASDQHIHTIDPFAGGSAESYKTLLIESGMSAEDAEAIAMVEALDANQYYMGSDSARVSLNLDIPVNQGWVVCVDRSQHGTQIFVTYLMVITSKKLLNQLESYNKSDILSKLKDIEEFKPFLEDISSLDF